MPEVTIKPADPIVPGRPSWFVYRDGEFVARVWEDAEGDWVAAAGDTAKWDPDWRSVCIALHLPLDTPEPTPAPEVETVEAAFCVAVTASGDWTVGDDERRAARFYYDEPPGSVRISWVTARVPLPAEPAEIVGEVVHGDD